MSQENHLTIEVCYAKSIVYDQDKSSTVEFKIMSAFSNKVKGRWKVAWNQSCDGERATMGSYVFFQFRISLEKRNWIKTLHREFYSWLEDSFV